MRTWLHNADSLHASTPSRVRALRAPAYAALDCDRRSGSEGNYAVLTQLLCSSTSGFENTEFLIPPAHSPEMGETVWGRRAARGTAPLLHSTKRQRYEALPERLRAPTRSAISQAYATADPNGLASCSIPGAHIGGRASRCGRFLRRDWKR